MGVYMVRSAVSALVSTGPRLFLASPARNPYREQVSGLTRSGKGSEKLTGRWLSMGIAGESPPRVPSARFADPLARFDQYLAAIWPAPIVQIGRVFAPLRQGKKDKPLEMVDRKASHDLSIASMHEEHTLSIAIT